MEKKLDDKTLLFIAIVCSFVGLLSLFLIMFFYELPDTPLNEVGDSKTKVNGYVEKITYSKDNETTFIRVRNTCYLDVLSFDNIVILNNSHVKIEGQMSADTTRKILIADKIDVIK